MAKKVIVTGASRGIGFELVQKYAEAGHEVIALSRNSDRLEQLKEACLQLNPQAQVHIFPFDLAKGDIAAQLMSFIESCFQHVDILINNAGALIAKPFTEINAEATTTVGITKGMKVKLWRNFLNLNSDFTNTLDMHSPITTDNAEETVACQIVNQRAFRTDTEVKASSKEEKLNPIESILPIG